MIITPDEANVYDDCQTCSSPVSSDWGDSLIAISRAYEILA